jgi:hypothetical protein
VRCELVDVSGKTHEFLETVPLSSPTNDPTREANILRPPPTALEALRLHAVPVSLSESAVADHRRIAGVKEARVVVERDPGPKRPLRADWLDEDHVSLFLGDRPGVEIRARAEIARGERHPNRVVGEAVQTFSRGNMLPGYFDSNERFQHSTL